MANTRVKVPRTTLIASIQARIDEATAEHEKTQAEYEEAKQKFLADLPGALQDLAKEVSAMKPKEANEFFERIREHSYHGERRSQIGVKIRVPAKPDESEYAYIDGRRGYRYHGFKGYIRELEKAKKILEASKEDDISVSATDFYADYL